MLTLVSEWTHLPDDLVMCRVNSHQQGLAQMGKNQKPCHAVEAGHWWQEQDGIRSRGCLAGADVMLFIFIGQWS